MPAFQVQAKDRARRFLDSLPEPDRSRVRRALLALGEEPFPRGALKVSGFEGAVFRVRVGGYRALYYVDAVAGAVYVTRIDKRSRAYR